MKSVCTYIILFLSGFSLCGQITGKVISAEDRQGIPGVTLLSDQGGFLAITGNNGSFEINSFQGSKLIFSHLSYKRDTLEVKGSRTGLLVVLEPSDHLINEVIISTGYQQLSERPLTGAFTHVNNELLSRSTGSDILSRLEGVTNALAFIRKNAIGEQESSPELQIRGKSTIHGDGNPLIVLDNFPYEGNIDNINPNDIESVTLLKDAAASSIWGARAGNGVIVITTKKGNRNKPLSVGMNSNVTIGSRPDLYYSPNFMSSADYIGVERELFNRGFHSPADWVMMSPVTEALYAGDEVAISKLNGIDYRKEASRLFYRESVLQQYSLFFRGGSQKYGYYLSGGYDDDQANIRNNQSRRYTLQTTFNFEPVKRLELSLGLNTVLSEDTPNGITISSMPSAGKQALPPYTVFTNPDGSPAVVQRIYRQLYVNQAEQNGLLNWQYRPLEEMKLNDIRNTSTQNRINAGLVYRVLPSLRLEVRYQHLREINNYSNNYSSKSFYARDLVNRFTQQNGTRIVPVGGIQQGRGLHIGDNSFRTQLNFRKGLKNKHELSAMGGVEVRQTVKNSIPDYLLYGVDEDTWIGTTMLNYATYYPTRPQGSMGLIPSSQAKHSYLVDRYLSYYANGSYLYNKRYSATFSARKDGANLFGIKTNQKFVPLWSAGLGWILSEEAFFPKKEGTFLKLRATFGYSGNTIRSVTAYPTGYYSTDSRTGLLSAILRTPGNPSLRWEKILTKNAGVDFGILRERIQGSLDYYIKDGLDLLGDNIMDPTTGLGFPPIFGPVLANRTNYANTHTKGFDMEITSRNTTGRLKWSSSALLNFVRSRVTAYEGVSDPNIINYTTTRGNRPPVEGSPVDPVYSLPWYGLSGIDGSPLVMTEGQLTTQYGKFLNGFNYKDLILSGSAVPTFSGSLRNTLDIGKLSFSTTLSWKAGYYFRASGINYNSLFTTWLGHKDYTERWVKPGDEQKTRIPSMPTAETFDASGRRDQVYTQSEVMVEKGNHLRWNDVNISYTLDQQRNSSLPVRSLKLFVYARNLGILWRANSRGLDPDYPHASYPSSLSYSIGLNINF